MGWKHLIFAAAMAAGTQAAADDHVFAPTSFYTTYSFANLPALRIRPGDRVITKTLDAAGVDWNGKQAAPGGNPLTGPFYVEGAEPGDLLVVKLEKVETNRATAFTSSLLAPYATDPAAIAARVDREPRRVIFDLDKARGVARLQDTTIQAGGVELPLKPMLGCIGVAPAGKEAIRAGTPGAWGGNMDYASMGAGMTLMLPVNEPGALLLLGDGHARQGQGEVVGTGLETSMDVTFTVQLIKKTKNAWPHAENARDIMVLASARPLIEAFQHATAEMQTWLMRDYGYSERGAQILMGQAAEYEVANVVDANFTVVAKMSKALLKKTP
jgi:amidase